jgi:hypothetical protein
MGRVSDNNGVVFLASVVVLAVMWVIFAARILLGVG